MKYSDFWVLQMLFDTKKAERWFNRTPYKVQYIDLAEKGPLSWRVPQYPPAAGLRGLGQHQMPAYQDLYMAYITPEAAEEKCWTIPLFRRAIVRNGKQATVGYCPDGLGDMG